MATQLEKSDPTRADEGDKPNNGSEVKGITNIYYDCLERIFDFLDLESLLNVAQTCKRLQIAAAAKFSDQYGEKELELCPFYERPMGIVGLSIMGLGICLPFLRCFGSKILNLYVNQMGTKENAKDATFLDQYINQYCSETLISIIFEFRSHRCFENCKKPFKNVTSLHTRFMNLTNQLPNFKYLMPNIRELELIGRTSIDETATEVFFPHLESLCIDLRSFITAKGAAGLLRANRQLQKLYMHCGVSNTLTEVLDLIGENPFIYELQISTREMDVDMVELSRLVAEHPSMVKLSFGFYRFSADDAISLIRQLNSLKYFKFCVKGELEYDRLLNQLGNEWQVQHCYDTVYQLIR